MSGSDDFTLFLWSPTTQKQPIARMAGHQQLVNHIAFSPDGRFIQCTRGLPSHGDASKSGRTSPPCFDADSRVAPK